MDIRLNIFRWIHVSILDAHMSYFLDGCMAYFLDEHMPDFFRWMYGSFLDVISIIYSIFYIPNVIFIIFQTCILYSKCNFYYFFKLVFYNPNVISIMSSILYFIFPM